MTFEEYFSFEAIVGDLIRWRLRGKDVGGTLPPRKMWSRAGVKDRKGVDPAVLRKQSILRTIFRYREPASPLPPHLYKSGGKRRRGDDTAKDAARRQKCRRDSRRALSKACLVTYCNM